MTVVKLDTLLDSSQEIIEVVGINLDALHSNISNQIARESSRQARDRLDTERRHTKTIAAILTTRDSQSWTITGPKYSKVTSEYLAKTGTAQTTTTYRVHGRSDDGFDNEAPDLETKLATDITKRILNALHFRRISERRLAVCPAYRKTFDWIYQDSKSHSFKCDSLVRVAQTRPWLLLGQWEGRQRQINLDEISTRGPENHSCPS